MALPTLVNVAMNKIEVVPPVILIISADNLFDSNHVEHAEKRFWRVKSEFIILYVHLLHFI